MMGLAAVRLVGVIDVGEGIGPEFFEDAAGDVFECGLVGRLQDDGCAMAGIEGLLPARGANAPAVARCEPGETVFGHRGAEVVSGGGGVGEKVRGHQGADAVTAGILRSGIAVTSAVETGERVDAAGLQRSAQDILGCVIHAGTLAVRVARRKVASAMWRP